MKSTVEKLSPTRVKLSIDVEFSELKPHIDGAYKTLSEKINIPGFRKGKVPAAMIDQRVGRGAVLDEAINAALPTFYSQAAKENDVLVIGRPNVDITELKDNEKLSFTVEVDIRPEVVLPDFAQIKIEVDDVVVTDSDLDKQIESLQIRFGTLTTVEKTVESGDFVSIDLLATDGGKEIDGGSANEISYEVGSASMIEGLDEALIGLKVGESKSFETALVGMPESQKASVQVTLKAVKKRELPPLDDAFAKLASEFETLAELKADLSNRLKRVKELEQGAQARDLLVEKLTSTVEIPLPAEIIEAEVNDHLEKEGRLADDKHRAEVNEEVKATITREFLLDSIVKAEAVSVNESELTEYLVRASSRYGMSPDQFIKEVSQAGQITTMVAEVARAKALAQVLGKVKIVDKSGKQVDIQALAPKSDSENKSE
ncbi:MAG: trigger factor [Actinobacteria bacterium BACL4 MAG-120820-bin23]|nr:MAG: trigger factor [Actinobacteria bacterium BACL4 MAG-120820-bin23]KRO50715.1 MAG: trigger factor [Actinobacteria bacterium BACL4 MAG-121001-bin59]KRO76161.1 MAG: trigger factor [Actinobacteria bacterium BACL4 MAG-120920-bin74]HCP72994.1 trigger factor [Actinomycetota bacterium]